MPEARSLDDPFWEKQNEDAPAGAQVGRTDRIEQEVWNELGAERVLKQV